MLRWAPPLAWMGVIAWLSGDAWSAEATAPWTFPLLQALLPWATPEQLQFLHLVLRKSGHVLEYALLAFLWVRALARGAGAPARAQLSALGITVGYAAFDEIRQGWTDLRTASTFDLLLDTGGAAAMLLGLRHGRGATLAFLTGLSLWVGALGGTLLLVLNLSVGVRGRWLWLSVPVAWIALWAWRRRCRLSP